MFVALCGDKGSPGVTSTALALASAWAGHAIAVEANPAGGDLAIRLHPGGSALPEAPTVLSVVTAARAGREQDPASTHAHALNSSTAVVPGPLLAEQMANVGERRPIADVGHLLCQQRSGDDRRTGVQRVGVCAGRILLASGARRRDNREHRRRLRKR